MSENGSSLDSGAYPIAQACTIGKRAVSEIGRVPDSASLHYRVGARFRHSKRLFLSQSVSAHTHKTANIHLLQYYVSLFHMSHVWEIPPTLDDYVERQNEFSVYRAFCVFTVCLRLFVTELAAFVYNEVRRVMRQSKDDTLEADMQSRLEALEEWYNDSEYPFSMRNEEVFANLILAVGGRRNIDKGLPWAAHARQIKRETFANNILSMFGDSTAKTLPPPLGTTPRTVQLLRIGYALIRPALIAHYSGSTEAADETILNVFRIVLCAAEIHVLPWPSNNGLMERMMGKTSSKATIEAWTEIGQQGDSSSDNIPRRSDMDRARASARSIAQGRSDTRWSLFSFNWDKLLNVTNYNAVPVEFSINNAFGGNSKDSASELVIEHYQWVLDNFKMSRPSHRFILYVGYIISHLLPNINIVLSNKPPRDLEGESLRRYLQALPTTGKKSNKGATKRKSWLFVFVAYAFAYLEKQSPMYDVVYSDSGAGLQWTAKHGASLYPLSQIENAYRIVFCLTVTFVRRCKMYQRPFVGHLQPRYADFPPWLEQSLGRQVVHSAHQHGAQGEVY